MLKKFCLLLLWTFCAADAHAAQQLSISGKPPEAQEVPIIGTAWYLFLDGEIDADAPARLERYIIQNRVPDESLVYINSPGGNMLSGMQLGRLFRKHRYIVYIGKFNTEKNDRFSSLPGYCYSSCALAYLGGSFRYLTDGSHYGVHRFAFAKKSDSDSDVAQVASASVVSYFREMDVDSGLFTAMTEAGPDQINEPSKEVLRKLGVVNEGIEKPKWTVESLEGGTLYLKGERRTVWGINKWMVFCAGNNNTAQLAVIFDPQGRQKEVMSMSAHSLLFGNVQMRVQPTARTITNGWYNALIPITPQVARAMVSASTVGVAVQYAYGAPSFLGFQGMPTAGAESKLQGILKGCRLAS